MPFFFLKLYFQPGSETKLNENVIITFLNWFWGTEYKWSDYKLTANKFFCRFFLFCPRLSAAHHCILIIKACTRNRGSLHQHPSVPAASTKGSQLPAERRVSCGDAEIMSQPNFSTRLPPAGHTHRHEAGFCKGQNASVGTYRVWCVSTNRPWITRAGFKGTNSPPWDLC